MRAFPATEDGQKQQGDEHSLAALYHCPKASPDVGLSLFADYWCATGAVVPTGVGEFG